MLRVVRNNKAHTLPLPPPNAVHIGFVADLEALDKDLAVPLQKGLYRAEMGSTPQQLPVWSPVRGAQRPRQ
jgi:hypothetical protein